MRSLFVAALVLVLAAPAAAQSHQREGLYVGFGMGPGRLGFSEAASGATPEVKVSPDLRIGTTVSPQWRVGFEMNGWKGDLNHADAYFRAFMVTATFYPAPRGDFFFKGGLGSGTYHEEYFGDEGEAGGTATTLGIGYDLRFEGNTGVTMYLNYVSASNWEYHYNDVPVDADIDPRLIQVGLGVTWH